LIGASNILLVSYFDADNDSIGRHEGSALIKCLNAEVYTHWSHRKAVPFLGKFVDFVPHKRSIAGPSLSQLEASVKGVEGRIEAKLEGLRENINFHTTKTIDVAVTTSTSRQEHILRQLQLLTNASWEYNHKMLNISAAQVQGQDESPQCGSKLPTARARMRRLLRPRLPRSA
jgi:hypothetical protein